MSEIGNNLFQLKRRGCRTPDSKGTWRLDHGPFLLDEDMGEVECGRCGEKMNPMAVIRTFMSHESALRRRYDYLKQEIEKAVFKSQSQNRVRCEHCAKLTRIRKEGA